MKINVKIKFQIQKIKNLKNFQKQNIKNDKNRLIKRKRVIMSLKVSFQEMI